MKWSAEQLATLRLMWSQARSTDEICAAVGKSSRQVTAQANWLGLGRRYGVGCKKTPELVARVTSMKESGALSWGEIAKAIGADRSAVRNWYYDNLHRIGSRGWERSMYQVERDALALTKLIPADTRDLTARLCGDPLPGRDALSKRLSTEGRNPVDTSFIEQQ